MGRDFIRVGCPKVEGEGAEFEEEAGECEQQAQVEDGLRGGVWDADGREVGGAKCAKEKAHAVERDGRGCHALYHVFGGAFPADVGIAVKGNDDIDGVGSQFHGDIEGEEFGRADHHHHAECGKDEEEGDLEPTIAVNGEGVGAGNDDK